MGGSTKTQLSGYQVSFPSSSDWIETGLQRFAAVDVHRNGEREKGHFIFG